MNPSKFQELTREAAAKDNVILTDHAVERMLSREISRIMVYKCLAGGTPIGKPVLDAKHKSYKCKLGHYMAGIRYEVVAAISEEDPSSIVVTVINKEDGYV